MEKKARAALERSQRVVELKEVLKLALEDLETWHSESNYHTDPVEGHWVLDPCDGCHTCQEVIPAIKKVLE